MSIVASISRQQPTSHFLPGLIVFLRRRIGLNDKWYAEGNQITQAAILLKAPDFDSFKELKKTIGEHDYGSFDHDKMRMFWKIDYRDELVQYVGDNSADPEQTTFALTIVPASDK